MITSVEEMINKYVNSWNNNNLEEFTEAFTECWATEATYLDPDFDLKGVDAIAGLAQKSLELYPTRKFYVLIKPEYHHNVGRYTWIVVLPEGAKQGTDFFTFNEAFQVTSIVSFF